MTVVGCTGGIGSGKSSVCALLGERGAYIIDADAIARALSASDGVAYGAIVDAFGREIVRDDGEIDRKQLAMIVFHDAKSLRRLEAIVHPHVERAVLGEIALHANATVVVDHPLLVETDGRERFGLDGLLVVDAPQDIALERLVTQRKMDPDDATARIAAQISREDRLRAADFILMNMGTREELALMVDNAWKWIMALKK
jgi:dephospho-CoA kinase